MGFMFSLIDWNLSHTYFNVNDLNAADKMPCIYDKNIFSCIVPLMVHQQWSFKYKFGAIEHQPPLFLTILSCRRVSCGMCIGIGVDNGNCVEWPAIVTGNNIHRRRPPVD